MRTIKFRFWIEKIKAIGDWEYALKQCDRLSLLNFPGFIPMQFTGLLDKNGKEIYEDDIVRVLCTDWPSRPEQDERTMEQYLIDISSIGTVVYKDHGFFIKFDKNRFDDYEYSSFNVGHHRRIEVIGNVFQDSEFLEVK